MWRVSCIWYQVSGIRYQISGACICIRYQVLGIRYWNQVLKSGIGIRYSYHIPLLHGTWPTRWSFQVPQQPASSSIFAGVKSIIAGAPRWRKNMQKYTKYTCELHFISFGFLFCLGYLVFGCFFMEQIYYWVYHVQTLPGTNFGHIS